MPRRFTLSLGLLLAAMAVPAFAADDKSAASEQRVFELRTYYTNAGKLNDLNKRFRDHTNRIFKKNGIEIIGFWTPQDEKEDKDGNGGKLIYLLAFPSREAAKKSWDAFRNDPEWQKAKAESEKDGVLVKKVDSVYLDPTDYSPIK
jgi:NIPSNAP